MTLREQREAVAQVIHDSFYAMQAGEFPDPETREPFNAGDLQLASDIQEAGLLRTEITDAQVEAARETISRVDGVNLPAKIIRRALEAARGAA